MSSYVQLLNTPLSTSPSNRRRRANGPRGRASIKPRSSGCSLRNGNSRPSREMSQQWREQAVSQQQAFQQVVQQSLNAYMDLFRPSRWTAAVYGFYLTLIRARRGVLGAAQP
jgi:hypothetical protein